MTEHSGTTSRKQRGQIMPLTLAGVVLAAILMIMLANLGNKVTEKSIVVNAADAAAYSGATWVAQHLNFMAYTNRAMIANHIGVGHFVAYMSWIRYIEEVSERVDDIGQFIPIVNLYTEALEEFATLLRELAEIEGEIYVPLVDKLNLFYSTAQVEAHAFINPERVDGVMQAAAEQLDPEIRINDLGALGTLNSVAATPIVAAIGLQAVNLVSFAEPLQVDDRDGEIRELVELTYQRGNMSREWLTDRGWKLPLGSNAIKKEFDTDHTLSNDLGNWETKDELVVETLFGKGPEITLASGTASAREFQDDYEGIHRYYNLSEEQPDDHVLPVIAFASKQQTAVKTIEVYDFRSKDVPLSGLAIAHVEHNRPDEGFPLTINDEYANLYNPFWQARLVGTSLFDITEAFPDVELPDFD